MEKKKFLIVIAIIVIAAAAVIASQLTEKSDSSTDTPTATATATASENAENKETSVPSAAESETVEKSDSASKTAAPNAASEKQSSDNAAATTEAKVQPTFMYFVTDEQESETAGLISDLKAEYPDVLFDIKNVTKNPELLDNFALVKGNEPALIMLDTSNNICGFEFSCTDKAKLEALISKALGN